MAVLTDVRLVILVFFVSCNFISYASFISTACVDVYSDRLLFVAVCNSWYDLLTQFEFFSHFSVFLLSINILVVFCCMAVCVEDQLD